MEDSVAMKLRLDNAHPSGASLTIDTYLERFRLGLHRISTAEVQVWSDLLYEAWDYGKFVYLFGNGGSGTTASHMCEDLGKSTLHQDHLQDERRKRLKVLSLSDNVGWITALGNDCGYEQIFVQQLMNFGRPGDVAIGISGSGNSRNVLTAIDWANRHGLKTFGLTGYDGGQLRRTAQAGLHVPIDDMGMIESVHLAVFHWVLSDVFARVNRVGRHRPSFDARPIRNAV